MEIVMVSLSAARPKQKGDKVTEGPCTGAFVLILFLVELT